MGVKASKAAKQPRSEAVFQEDILRIILAELPRKDLKSASLVDRNLAVVSRCFIFQEVVLSIEDEEKCKRKLETLRTSPTLPGYVKKLVVTGDLPGLPWYSYVRDCYDGSVNVQVAALETLQEDVLTGVFRAGLMEVRWEAGLDMPVALIEAIQITFPKCDFVLERYVRSSLPPMPNLVSLTANAHCHFDPLVHFQPILRQSPRLRHLQIQAYVRSGCVMQVIRNEDDGVKPFLTGDWDKPICGTAGPLLESLVLHNETWSVKGVAKCITDMSWSRLRMLELQRGHAAPLLRACVPASSTMPELAVFKYTTWGGSHGMCPSTAQLRDFLATANGLQTLHLEGPYLSVVKTIATSHGNTLQSLTLHDHERADKPQRTPMSTADLVELGERCLSLQHLGIDVDEGYTLHAGTSPSEPGSNSLTAILNHDRYFPALRTLTLYALLGIAHEAEHLRRRQTPAPLDDLKARVPSIIFPDIGDTSSTKPQQSAKIRTITVQVGEVGRQIGVGNPAHWVIWEQDTRTAVTLEVATEGCRDAMINVSQDGGISLYSQTDAQPTAWTVTRGNRWVVTQRAP